MQSRLWLCLSVLVVLVAPAFAKPPLEAFGDAPVVRSASLSPDGKTIAYINRAGGVDYLASYDIESGKNELLIKIPDLKAGGVSWAGSGYIILRASVITSNAGLTNRYEDTSAFAYSVATKKIVQLLLGTPDVSPYQSGFGRILGIDPGGQYVYMPSFVDHPGVEATYDLMKVSLETGRGAKVAGRQGTSSTIDWVVDDSGKAVARVDFSPATSLYEIRSLDDRGGSKVIYSETTKDPSFQIVGFSERDGAVVAAKAGDSEFQQLFEVSLSDGKLTGPLQTRTDADIEGVIRDENKVVKGVAYSGLYPRYQMFDEALNKDIKSAAAALPDAAVSLVSWSADWSRLLLSAEGGAQPPRYMLFDRTAKKLSQVARARPDIKPEEIGEVITIEYKARDGLTIPALITWPAGVPADKRKNLPLVVMPHGGPESYSSVGFDWLAQFLANEGYVVLEPNFRGSGGFGQSFAQAGYGQWGRKMQDDITDGVQALATMGWADPARTCILGWSYGGYAALAGGALTPDLYKCVVAIAGVSDLKSMLGFEKRERGAQSSSFDYWTKVIGDPAKDGAAIDAVSPARLAAKFKAPVLLIHGSDDLTVPDQQSQVMADALRGAGKTVTFLRIGRDDHNLTSPESRNKALTAIRTFLKAALGD